MLEYWPVIVPSILGYVAAFACKMDKSSGNNVKYRPPSWVFGVMWPILYIMLGISWYMCLQNKNYNNMLVNILYGFLVLLITLWVVVYSCGKNKKMSVFVLLGSVMAVFMTFTIGDYKSRLLLCPLIGWLIFATMMNTTEVQNE